MGEIPGTPPSVRVVITTLPNILQGKWAPRRIPNPAYFEDETPFHSLLPVTAVGFELWSMDKNIFFDNIIVTSELTIANIYARDG